MTTTKKITFLLENKNSKILLKWDQDTGEHTIIKTLKQDQLNQKNIIQFSNEFELTHGLSIPGIRKALTIDHTANASILTLEYIPGITLSNYIKKHPSNVENFLKIAIRLAQILSTIHQQKIIHKDINPNNIIIDPNTKKVTIIDFGISTKINLKTKNVPNLETLEGTLPYISPEQTGRMNRVIDYRADLYSLGVTLYQLLTGYLPFQCNDAIGWVHAHIAKQAVFPDHIPQPFKAIISKLMAKNADDRYQSADGLRLDLEHCLAQLTETGVEQEKPF